MPGSKSNAFEDLVLDSALGRSTTEFSTANAGVNPSTMVIALYNSTINDTWTTTSTGECLGSTYARIKVTNSSANWTNSTAGSKQNKTTFTFTSSAGSDWGTIQAFAIMNTTSTATAAGRAIMYWGDLTSNQVISAGNIVRFSTGSIVITED